MRSILYVLVLAGCASPDGKKPSVGDTAGEGPVNTAPGCAITSPLAGDVGLMGERVVLEATVSDADGALDALEVTWASDHDGPMGESPPDAGGLAALEVSDLSINTHAITLRVSDAHGGQCTDSVAYDVQGVPPSLSAVSIGPTPAHSRDTLTCEYSGFDSPMGGGDQSTVAWSVNGVPLSAVGQVLSGEFTGEDEVTCTVSPHDGLMAGTSVSASVTIEPSPEYDPTPVWPLCGRITQDPPPGWNESDGCPSDRWNSAEYTDYPINSTFGPRQLWSADYRYDYHRGIDLSADIGTPVFAVAPGEVLKAGEYSSYSDPIVQLRHYRPGSEGSCVDSGCWHTNYLHMSSWSVSPGDTVARGDLIGHTGASASGYPHLHFEVRDARADDPYSVWQRDAVHPLSVLPLPADASAAEVSVTSVDASTWERPIVDVLVAFRSPMPALDMARVSVRVFALDGAGSAIEVPQPYDKPWFVDPPFFDVDAWNLQYTHKDSSGVPWESFSDCPYADAHAGTYDAHVHMDRADPGDMGVGLFNGVEVAPAFYNESTEAWLLELRFSGLSAPTEAAGLSFVAELTDVHGDVIGSVPLEVLAR